QQVQAWLLLAVLAVAAARLVLVVPGVEHAAADQEALGIRRRVVPSQAVRQGQGELAVLLLAGGEPGGNVRLNEARPRRPRLHQALPHRLERRPGIDVLRRRSCLSEGAVRKDYREDRKKKDRGSFHGQVSHVVLEQGEGEKASPAPLGAPASRRPANSAVLAFLPPLPVWGVWRGRERRAGEVRAQCRKCRTPVNSIATPASSAAAIASSSRLLPPGWTIAVTPALMSTSRPSRKGKKAS